MSLDILNPVLSVMAKGMEGKKILLYGSNNLGKTYQASRLEKPYFIAFEKGLAARPGIPFAPINKWSEFTKIVKQFEKKPEAKDLYKTIIIDGADVMARYCEKYICDTYNVNRIKDGNKGYGLWSEFETELWEQLNKFLSLDFTLVFITHEEVDENGKATPKGNKRLMPTIRDNCDFTIYLKSNGIDDDGRTVKSSAYLAETDEYFARSKFEYGDTYLEEFTAENLKKLVVDAVKRQEEAEGIKAVTYEEQKEVNSSESQDFDSLMNSIKETGKKLIDEGKLEIMNEVVEKHLGKDKKVTGCTPKQLDVMSVILDDLNDLLD
ncbi:ATP-binding protein [Bacillus safensis]|uniref:ATP-binding protein n=1 Tax=Bacillus safensis TaxID=561879 RepID=UPI00146B8FC7|nr:ATP-binding protein [Bacillus safensis]MCM3365984.1 ATP-binding protein [Bacillus safensis]NMW01888.1 ATP-binding protein [Bacillus safensis]